MAGPMRESKSKTESLWSDVREWLKAIIHHWVASAGCALVAVFQICYGIWHRDWPPALSWAILAACFVWATFLAWRDEHRKTIGKERRSILNKVVELRAGKRPDLLAALINVSDEFGSEEDVEWVCQELDEQGHGDPFRIIGAAFKPGFDGKRLKFLLDARVAQIRHLGEAIEYVHNTWASKNGLTRKDAVALNE
jgi:hypothetical protein